MQILHPFLRIMKNTTKILTHSALIGSLYVVLTLFQNIMFPESTSYAIQFRASEALCVLAFFTPAAVFGLTVGCLLFNLTYAVGPLDIILGPLATLLAAGGMYLTRNWRIKRFPLLGLLLPGVFNGLLVGLSLSIYIGGGFWLNALYVAIGEWAVLLTLGTALYYAISHRELQKRIF